MSFELPIDEWSTPLPGNKIAWANHTGSAGPASKREIQKRLYDEGPYAAIHYDDIFSMESGKYDDGKSQIDNLHKFTKNSVPILVKYSEIGKIVKGIAGELYYLIVNKDTGEFILDPFQPKEGPDSLPEIVSNNDSAKILKGFSIENGSVIDKAIYPAIYDSGPHPPYNPLCGWKKVDYELLKCVFNEDPLPYTVGALTSSQIESAAEEFIRLEHQSACQLGPEGGQQQDIDNWFVEDSGRMIFSQVTESEDSSTVRNKQKQLNDWLENDSIGYLFAPKNTLKQVSPVATISQVPLGEMFDALDSISHTRKLLQQMLARGG